MDANIIVEVVLAVVSMVLVTMGVLLKIIYDKGEDNERAINDHKLTVARDYLPRIEMTAVINAIDKRIDKMEHWLGRRFDSLLHRELSSQQQGYTNDDVR
jgi:hypothetical protein